MKRTITTLLLPALILLAAACGGGSDTEGTQTPAPADAGTPAAAGSGSVEFVATEFAFDPSEASVPADTDITVSLRNDGNIEHDWSIKDQDLNILAAAGQTGTGTLNLPPGTYTFYCSIPGHEAAGMVGTLTVG